jgi:hypothetical protein
LQAKVEITIARKVINISSKKSILNLIWKKKLAKKGIEVGTSSNRVL